MNRTITSWLTLFRCVLLAFAFTGTRSMANQYVTDNQDYQNYFKILNLTDASGKINSVKEVLKVISVKGYGAAGDGTTDDTAAIRSAIAAANATGGVVYFQPGTYKVTSTLVITNGQGYGCRLEGANSGGNGLGVTILSTLPGTAAVFEFDGTSAFSNVGISNMTIKAATTYTGTGIRINGQRFAKFHNIQLVHLNYGVWLHNQSAGAASDANQFDEVIFECCTNGVRMEQGGGTDSFDGDVFTSCYFNVNSGQVGFNVVSGHYHGGRFQLFLWGHAADAVYVNADGDAEMNVGDITMEGSSMITGRGTFWYQGSVLVLGGITDATASVSGWKKVFVCDNYFPATPYGSSGMTCRPLNTQLTAWDGPLGDIMSLQSYNVQAVLINCYKTGNDLDNNGLFLGRTGSGQNETSGSLGMFVAASGAQIKSYCPSGLRLVTRDGNVALRASGDGIAIGDGAPIAKYLSVTTIWDPPLIGAGAYATTTVSVPGAAAGDLVITSHDKMTTGQVEIYGAVTAANTVTVTLCNQAAGSLNVSSGTLRVSVLKHTATSAVPVGVQGAVRLQNYSGDPQDLAVRLDLCQNGITVQTSRTFLDPNGGFTVGVNAGAGTYDVAIKEAHSLRQVITGVTLTNTGPTNLGTITLRVGDSNSDNRISFEDFSILQNNYGQSGAAVSTALSSTVAADLPATGNCGPVGILLLAWSGLGFFALGPRKGA